MQLALLLRYWREALGVALLIALGLVWLSKEAAERRVEKYQSALAECEAMREVQNAHLKQVVAEAEAEHARQQNELERARQRNRDDAPAIAKLEESAKQSHPGCISPALRERLPL